MTILKFKALNPVAISSALFLVIGTSFGLVSSSHAFELILKPTRTEAKLAKKNNVVFRSKYPLSQALVHAFGDPVHEAITHLAYDYPGSLVEAADADLDTASTAVIAGVRWNDDPPFQFSKGQGNYFFCKELVRKNHTISYPLAFDCWLQHFEDVKSKASKDPALYVNGNGTLLARSHFGDLQFLHSMATQKHEPANITQSKLLMWAEFTWRVQAPRSQGNIAHSTKMGKIPVAGMKVHFPEKEDRDVLVFFTQGRPWLRHNIKDVAFGSLLHMVQDSFSSAHVHRRVRQDEICSIPEIVRFHTYAGQNTHEHKSRDSIQSASALAPTANSPMITVLKRLITLREAEASWDEVKTYLETCALRIASDAQDASPEIADR